MQYSDDILAVFRTRGDGLDQAGQRSSSAADPPKPNGESSNLLEEQFQFLKQELSGYELLMPIRRGGQGLVFQARQHRPNRVVALKVLLDGPLATERQRYRFEREVEMIARLNHPNIVTLFETGLVHGRLFFTMEYLEGLAIDDYVIFHDLRPKQIVSLVRKVCQAVHHAHQNGIIHRDLNPANILIDERGEPHVFDFGLATDVLEPPDGRLFSCTGQILGTLPYLSPEQAGGLDGKTDVRSDVYALGVILYHLLTDQFPYDVSGNPNEVRSSIVSRDPVPLSAAVAASDPDRAAGVREVNRDLAAIVAKALAKQKAERYQSVEAMADDLERYCTGQPISASAPRLGQVLRAAIRKHRTAAAVLATSLVATIVGTTAVTVAWLEARTQRDNARVAATAAYNAFDMALQDIEQGVRPLPGGVAVRDQLLRKLDELLPTLKNLADKVQLAPVTASLYEKQGDIAAEQNRKADARELYRQFLEAALGLEHSNPDNDEYADQVTRATHKLAGVSDDPAPLYARAIAHGKAVLAKAPTRDEARFALADTYVDYGTYLKNTSDYRGGENQIDSALDLAPVDLNTASLQWRRLGAIALSAKGRALVERGRSEAGIAAIEQGLKLRERIVDARPVDVDALRGLIMSRKHLAELKRSAGDRVAATGLLSQAVAEADRLARMDPSALGWDSERFALEYQLGTLLLDSNEPEVALQHCNNAVRLGEGLFQSDPTDSSPLSFALVLKGRVRMADQRASEALPDFRRALSLREAAQTGDPENVRLKQLVAESYYWVGSAMCKGGDVAPALPYYRRSRELFAEIAGQPPETTQHSLDWIDASVSLAAACLRCAAADTDVEAGSLLREAEGALDELEGQGRFVDLDYEYAHRMQTIHKNLRILESHQSP